jgi:cysteine synthase A
MADSFSIERRKLMRAYGAKVILTPAAERGSGMVRRAEELAKQHGWFLARQFTNPANPAYHRQTTAAEILRDFAGDRLDHFVTGWGTGGTLTGVAEVRRCCPARNSCRTRSRAGRRTSCRTCSTAKSRARC